MTVRKWATFGLGAVFGSLVTLFIVLSLMACATAPVDVGGWEIVQSGTTVFGAGPLAIVVEHRQMSETLWCWRLAVVEIPPPPDPHRPGPEA